MSNKIKGYLLKHNNEKFPVGVKTPFKDIYNKQLFTGDVVKLNTTGSTNFVCSLQGDIMGVWNTTIRDIKTFKVEKIKSYKDLADKVEFNGIRFVLEEKTKQNHVETIKHIINGNTSIVILEDGRKGIAKCHPDDEFDKRDGFIRAYNRACGIEMDNGGNELKVNKELWEEFLNEEVVVNCETLEDRNLFFKYLNNKSFTSNIINFKTFNYAHYNISFRNDLNKIDYISKLWCDIHGRRCKIITFKELFNLTPPKQLSDYTNEELLEELKSRLE